MGSPPSRTKHQPESVASPPGCQISRGFIEFLEPAPDLRSKADFDFAIHARNALPSPSSVSCFYMTLMSRRRVLQVSPQMSWTLFVSNFASSVLCTRRFSGFHSTCPCENTRSPGCYGCATDKPHRGTCASPAPSARGSEGSPVRGKREGRSIMGPTHHASICSSPRPRPLNWHGLHPRRQALAHSNQCEQRQRVSSPRRGLHLRICWQSWEQKANIRVG